MNVMVSSVRQCVSASQNHERKQAPAKGRRLVLQFGGAYKLELLRTGCRNIATPTGQTGGRVIAKPAFRKSPTSDCASADASSLNGGRTVRQVESPEKCAMIALSAGMTAYLSMTLRTRLSCCCSSSAPGVLHSLNNWTMAAALTLPVAVMHPAPPPRRFASRKRSLPANTSKGLPANASSIAFVLFQSP